MNIKQYEAELVADLQNWLRINSVKDERDAKPRQPFGRGIADALEYVLKRAEDFGFYTVNVDGYAGRIEWGSGKDEIGVLGHVDVVPAGEGWKYPPFSAELVDGRLYGRGTMDDKGPVMAALYAMRALKESGVTPAKKVVMILGCDEESGWECMSYYESKYKFPTIGFTPDSEFPLINAEKGIFQAKYELPFPQTGKVKIKALLGGDRLNVVPGTAHMEAECEGSSFETNAEGTQSHGSTPELGSNALWTVFEKLNKIYEDAHETSPVQELYKMLCRDYDGTGMGIKMSDSESGPLTINFGYAELWGGKLFVGIDIRYPVTKNRADIEQAVEGKLRAVFGDEVKRIHEKFQKPHHMPADSPLVKTLLEAYRAVTFDYSGPVATGGGTYAKAMPNCVAFGARYPGHEHLEHKTNEYVTVSNLLKTTEIYAEAIKRLLELDA